MTTILPSRIMDYTVTAASPTDELLTLGQILSEVGDYASTILDREHLALSRKCATRLADVIRELMARRRIKSQDELYEMPETTPAETDLSTMTVSELHSLYRLWPARHKERQAIGKEHVTFYFEGRIVRELLSRKPANRSERLKMDYCIATYNNELENMSFIFSRPVKINDDKVYPKYTKEYSAKELASLINRYTEYKDIIEREILIEYVDRALNLLNSDCPQTMADLVAELERLRKKGTIHVPRFEMA